MFNYYQPTRIHFGERLDELGEIAKRYGKKVLLVTTADEVLRPLYERIKRLLMEVEIEVLHFDKVKPNPSVEIVEEGVHLLLEYPVDFVLAVGGGSSIDTAKAIAFTNGIQEISWDDIFSKFSSPFENYEPYTGNELPILSIPTTSGTGSQVTQASVLSRGDEKITFFHPLLFSRECILDPSLTLTLPSHIRSATGFDAFTHAFESYLSKSDSEYVRIDAVSAMKLVIENLPDAMEDPLSPNYRSNMMLADTLAGRSLANGGAAAPHPLSEIIGGILHIPHGEALAIVFPAFIKIFEKQYEKEFNEIAKLFDETKSLYDNITSFLEEIRLDKKLSDYEISESQYDAILNSPTLEHLPFGSLEDLQQVLKNSY